jgi:hypothetical protein
LARFLFGKLARFLSEGLARFLSGKLARFLFGKLARFLFGKLARFLSEKVLGMVQGASRCLDWFKVRQGAWTGSRCVKLVAQKKSS